MINFQNKHAAFPQCCAVALQQVISVDTNKSSSMFPPISSLHAKSA